MPALINEVWLAARHLPRQPLPAATLITILAVGAVVTTVSYDVIAAYLWRSLPFPNADRLVVADYPRENGPTIRALQEMDWQAARDIAELVVASDIDVFTVIGGSAPFSTDGQWMSADVFALFAAVPVHGRFFSPDEAARGERVAVISHQVWRERFNADPAVIGRLITTRATLRQGTVERFTIVGVVPSSFSHLDNRTGLILPLNRSRPPTLMRLRQGVTPDSAAARLTAIARAQASDIAGSWLVRVQPAHDAHIARIRPMLSATMTAVGLLGACAFANLVFLQMARGVRRQREMAVRAAVGANRRMLIRQTAAEGLAIGCASAVIATVITLLVLRSGASAVEGYLGRLVPGGTDSLGNPIVLAVAAVATMFSSLILAAVLHLTSNARADASLLAGSASTTETPGRTLVRHIIASGQVAVAFSLLVTAVLLVRSAWHLAKIDLGFDPRNVLTANVTLHESRYRRVEDRRRFFASLLSELQRLPNVTHASLTGWLPFRVGPATWLEPESVMIEPIRVSMRAVSPGYFDALRIHVVDGRPITADDIASRPSTAVVSRTLTRSVWGDDNSLGRKFRIRFSNERSRPGFGPFTVVGIVDDTLESLVEPTPPQIYLAFNQQPLATNAFLHVRTSASPLDLSPAVARVLGAADPELPLSEPATLESVVAREGLRPRFLSRLLTSLAGAALAITVIGLSAVSAWIAQQRQREAALRVALGATRSSVTFLVIRRGCIGLGTGLAAGWVTTNPVTTRVATELYGISATDLGTRISVAVALAVISALALWLPAWRASGRALSALLRAE